MSRSVVEQLNVLLGDSTLDRVFVNTGYLCYSTIKCIVIFPLPDSDRGTITSLLLKVAVHCLPFQNEGDLVQCPSEPYKM